MNDWRMERLSNQNKQREAVNLKFTMTWINGGMTVNETYGLKTTSLKKAEMIFEDMIREYNEEEKRRYGKEAHLRKLISVCKSLIKEES